MNSITDFEGPNDVTSVREVQLDNGNILRAYRENPYGFIRFKLDKGQLPAWMQGSFTSYNAANKALQQYLSVRQMDSTETIQSKKHDRKEKT